MNQPDLLVICGAAFTAVFLLLTLLAVVMRLLIEVFPERTSGIDSATLAAVTAAVAYAIPGAKITNIEESS